MNPTKGVGRSSPFIEISARQCASTNVIIFGKYFINVIIKLNMFR